ncbi:MAG: hypothetical protein HYX92_21155 [Chloroflexi bacterium]|nr:hypothetical protein [Chloroflexota bacterium]
MSVPDWQLTATTVFCEAVNGEATLLVYGDGSARCIAYKRYCQNGATPSKGGCVGTECRKLIEYRDQLLAEGTES